VTVDRSGFDVLGGLVTMGPEVLSLKEALERTFLSWAAECGADRMLFPPLMRVSDLAGLDYFRNFPHLPLVVTRIDAAHLKESYVQGPAREEIPAEHLTHGAYVLPSAACYNIYIHLRGTRLNGPRYITTVASCFRNEQHYEELKRLWGFTMREIVCLGTAEEVQSHLASFKQRLLDFTGRLGLSLETEVATDPFYEPQNSRAVMQRLFPQKEELVYGGAVAIGSLNFHRNFFGERCDIRTADGEAAFTGCVAFGIERWIHALLDRFQGDPRAVAHALDAFTPGRPGAPGADAGAIAT
jgi:seryl-tRNA synthetase